MTLREQYIGLIGNMTDRRLAVYVAFLKDLEQLCGEDFEEVLDDFFCIQLADRHKRNNPDFNEADFMPIEDVAAELGIDLGADYED